MLKYTLSLVFIIQSFLLFSQEYDYVLPDTLPDREKRAGLKIPIKNTNPSPQYVRPSYASSESDDMKTNYESEDDENSENDSIQLPKNRTSVNLELGSSVSSDFNGNTAINTYAAPNVRHQVNDELAITGGVVMSQTFFDGWKGYSLDGAPMPTSINTNMVYGRVDYRVSEKMLVYGTVFTNITTMPTPGLDRNLQGTGYSLGMEYKISDKSFLQIQVQQSSGYNPFMPYSRNRSVGFGGRPFSYFP